MSKLSATRNEAQRDWLALVAEQVAQLRFGVVQITVHESRVVQIERTERVRLDKLPTESASPTHQPPVSNQLP
jgi:hypothetical protein